MTTAFNFLQDDISSDDGGPIAYLGETPDDFPTLSGSPSISPLTDRGAILVMGNGVHKLLQGQLTCDLNQLSPTTPLKGALCDNKGRMVCSLHCVQSSPDSVLLLLHRGLVNITLETLKKYAVFFKTTLEDVSGKFAVMGLQGTKPEAEQDRTTSICHLTDDLSWLVCPAEKVEALWRKLARHYRPCGEELWNHLLIASGEGEVRPQTTGLFIPQMLNFQHTGAVSFRKGCYTGQEIVARMQYLGKLKRRMYHLRTTTSLGFSPGDTVASTEKSDVGTVVLATSGGASRDILAVLTEDAVHASNLSIGEYTGHFDVIPLPYERRLEDSGK